VGKKGLTEGEGERSKSPDLGTRAFEHEEGGEFIGPEKEKGASSLKEENP